MHRNMKNFYDQQDINNLKIDIVLSPTLDKDFPELFLKINTAILHEGLLKESVIFQHQISLMDALNISIELRNKNYKTSPRTAVSIDSLKIDNFDIVPNWTQLATYNNDSNVPGPTNHLGFNGVWSLEITEPFYRWQHRVTGQGWLLKP